MSSQLTGAGSDETTAGEYGANEWLVDEMYEKYLADPDSVDQTWWPVLEQYRQVRTGTSTNGSPISQTADAASAPAPEAAARRGPRTSAARGTRRRGAGTRRAACGRTPRRPRPAAPAPTPEAAAPAASAPVTAPSP